jgi:hypothetical protein
MNFVWQQFWKCKTTARTFFSSHENLYTTLKKEGLLRSGVIHLATGTARIQPSPPQATKSTEERSKDATTAEHMYACAHEHIFPLKRVGYEINFSESSMQTRLVFCEASIEDRDFEFVCMRGHQHLFLEAAAVTSPAIARLAESERATR